MSVIKVIERHVGPSSLNWKNFQSKEEKFYFPDLLLLQRDFRKYENFKVLRKTMSNLINIRRQEK